MRLPEGRPGNDPLVTICWRGTCLWITFLPVDAMGRLAACVPAHRAELEVWAALLAGKKVYVSRDALEYRRYRKSAPLGVYRKCGRWSGN